MRTLEYTFWQDGEFFLGYLNSYPDYETQAYTKDELIENLRDCSSILNRMRSPLSEGSRSWSLLEKSEIPVPERDEDNSPEWMSEAK